LYSFDGNYSSRSTGKPHFPAPLGPDRDAV